jgi:hypothetical protein
MRKDSAISSRRTLTGLVMFAASAVSQSGAAAEVTLPHTFTAGQKALASDVNANFTALEAGVDDNARMISELQAQIQALQTATGGAGGLSVIIAGQKVGAFVTDGPADPNFSIHSMDGAGLLGVSDKGYFFEVSLGENDDGSPSIVPEGALAPATTYFTQANCAGTKYLAIPFGELRFMWRQGFVVAATDPDDTVKAYRAKGTPAELSMFSYQSRTSSSGASCTDLAVAEVLKSLPLVPNDPAVTGLQDEYAGIVQLLPR